MAPASANVRRAAVGARKKIENFPKELDLTMQFCKWTAESLEAAHDEEKVAALREATREMAGLQESLRLHVAALSEVENGRLAPNEGQSFADVLHSRTMEMAAQEPRAPEDYEGFKAFDRAIWDVHHKGEPMPGEEEEDIVMTSKDLVANAHCPLSMKAVEELDEPVCAKDCRHIYEAMNARDYFGRGARGCAVAGCNKQVTLNVLISDSRLIQDLEELKRNKRGGRNTQQAEDYTALDDED